VHNPVDFTAGYITPGNTVKFATAVKAVLDDRGVDAVCVNFATTGGAGCQACAAVLAELAVHTSKPRLVFLSTPANEVGEALRIFARARIAVLPSPVRVARAIATLAALREARTRNAEHARLDSRCSDMPTMAPGGTLSEADSKAVLERIGIAVTRDV